MSCHWVSGSTCLKAMQCLHFQAFKGLEMEMQAFLSLGTLENTNPVTQCHIPEHLNPPQYHTENFKSYTAPKDMIILSEYCCQYVFLSWLLK